VWRDRTALAFLVGVFFVSLVFMQNQGALPLYLVRDLHYRESFYGMLFVVNTLLIVVAEVPLNLAMAHWPHRRSLMLGALLTAVGFGLVGITRTPLPIAATVVIWTFGEMIFFPASTSYVADIAPPGRTGEYMGAFASMFSLALIFGPWAGTAALDHLGAATMWGGVFLAGIVALAVISVSHPRQSALGRAIEAIGPSGSGGEQTSE
jgi:MFS family permease